VFTRTWWFDGDSSPGALAVVFGKQGGARGDADPRPIVCSSRCRCCSIARRAATGRRPNAAAHPAWPCASCCTDAAGLAGLAWGMDRLDSSDRRDILPACEVRCLRRQRRSYCSRWCSDFARAAVERSGPQGPSPRRRSRADTHAKPPRRPSELRHVVCPRMALVWRVGASWSGGAGRRGGSAR